MKRNRGSPVLYEHLLYTAVGITLVFAFVNGFDGGSVIATLICSRVMRPRRALFWATLAEFLGPLALGTAVAHTMASSILKPKLVEQLPPESLHLMVIAAVGAAITWCLLTWLLRLPSSSSHALIGGILGAGLIFVGTSAVPMNKFLMRVVAPLFLSPVIGLIVGFLVFTIIKGTFGRYHRRVGRLFVPIQKPCMFFLAASHGANDAQKSMGVIALALAAGYPHHLGNDVPEWVVVGCAAAIAMGLSLGGWRIVKTVGYGICRVEPVHSFASQFSTASVVLLASILGGPVSTAQVASSSVMGVGAARRLSGVKWSAALNIVYAWFLTIPISAALGAGCCYCLKELLHP
jgi:PiT family inorganic phosphate transporter